MPLLLAALAIMTISSCFLALRSLIHLYQERQYRLAVSSTIIFIVMPLLIGLDIAFAPHIVADIWLLLPAIMLFIGWLAFGYWLAWHLAWMKRQQMTGIEPAILERPRHYWRNNLLLLGCGLLIWVLGLVVDIAAWPITEVALLCAAMFLVGFSVFRLWKYRGF